MLPSNVSPMPPNIVVAFWTVSIYTVCQLPEATSVFISHSTTITTQKHNTTHRFLPMPEPCFKPLDLPLLYHLILNKQLSLTLLPPPCPSTPAPYLHPSTPPSPSPPLYSHPLPSPPSTPPPPPHPSAIAPPPPPPPAPPPLPSPLHPPALLSYVIPHQQPKLMDSHFISSSNWFDQIQSESITAAPTPRGEICRALHWDLRCVKQMTFTLKGRFFFDVNVFLTPTSN